MEVLIAAMLFSAGLVCAALVYQGHKVGDLVNEIRAERAARKAEEDARVAAFKEKAALRRVPKRA